MNDLVNFAMERACEIFSSDDKTFNNSSFSKALQEIGGLQSVIDGRIVRMILLGRNDVEMLPGGCHYRYITS